jgi:hypothetical protein
MSFPQKVDQGYLSFARGLVTEINPLSTPEELQGTTSDELNMIVDTDGMIRVRRDGFSIVPDLLNEVQGTVLDVRYWRKGKCYVVCAVLDGEVSPGEREVSTTFIDESAAVGKNRQFKTKIRTEDFVLPSICFLRTKCLIAYGSRPLLYTRSAGGEFTVEYVNLHVRDFKLVDDGLTVTNRPTFLSGEHKYNLYNAGWYQRRKLKGTNVLSDPITSFQASRTTYPSNADVAYLGDITNTDGDLRFDPQAFDSVNVGSTEAPRGHYVYDIRSIDREARVSSPDNDGVPSNTLTVLVENGNTPGTSTPVPPTDPIDDPYPELPPGYQIP